MKKIFKKLLGIGIAAVMVLGNCLVASANESIATLKLSDANAIAGKLVTVNLTMETGNLCAGYNVDIEYDERLTPKFVEGVAATCQIENVITLVNFTGTYFADNEIHSSITFEVPKDVEVGTEFEVKFANIGNFTTDTAEFENCNLINSTITVIEAPAENSISTYLIFNEGSKEAEVGLRGDANNNGSVDVLDAIALCKEVMGNKSLEANEKFFGDVNQDCKIDLMDVISVCKFTLNTDKDWNTIDK
ncbi:MAG: dockerin type I repeat-containing protein [Candidatus Aphodosoma sp.]